MKESADYVEKPEFEYVKEDYEMKQKDKEGNELDSIYCKRLTVTCWVKENKTEEIFQMNFTIYDLEMMYQVQVKLNLLLNMVNLFM